MIRTAFIAMVLLIAAACSPKVERPVQDATPAASASTKDVYEFRCAFCHGMEGKGDTPTANAYPNANIADDVWAYGGTKQDLVRSIGDGVPGTPMRGFSGTLNAQEIDAIATYVQSLAAR